MGSSPPGVAGAVTGGAVAQPHRGANELERARPVLAPVGPEVAEVVEPRGVVLPDRQEALEGRDGFGDLLLALERRGEPEEQVRVLGIRLERRAGRRRGAAV